MLSDVIEDRSAGDLVNETVSKHFSNDTTWKQ